MKKEQCSVEEKEARRRRGKNNKTKGSNLERKSCNYFRSVGLIADRTAPMQAKNPSGKQTVEGSKDYPDVIVYNSWVDGNDFKIECKNWKQFTVRKLWDWLDEHNAHAIIFKVYGKKPLIAVDPEVFAELLGVYNEISRRRS